MTFLHVGLAVAGLAAVAIPIIIHLISRRRRRPIEWAAMRFLMEAFRKHRRRLQLEQILLLLTRCLVVLLLGAALARPMLEQAGLASGAGGRTVFLVIDDGVASQVRTGGSDAMAFASHIDQARAILEALSPDDRVGVITAARPAEGRVVPPSSDHAAIGRLLDRLEPSDAPTELAQALRVTAGAVEELPADRAGAVVYLLSEFRAGSAPLDRSLDEAFADVSDRVTLLAMPAVTAPATNAQIASVQPVRPMVIGGESDVTSQVRVRVRREAVDLDEAVSQVRLSGPELPTIEPRTVRWSPGQDEADVDVMVDLPGDLEGELALTARLDADDLAADDRRHAMLHRRSRVRVGLLDRRSFGVDRSIEQLSAGRWLERALRPFDGAPIEVREIDPAAVDQRDLQTVDVVVAPRPDVLSESGWAAVAQFVERGGLLIVTPPGGETVHGWVDALREAVGVAWSINLEAEQASEDAPWMLAGEQPNSEMLRLISNELGDLARPVVSWRRLAVSGGNGGESFRELLVFADDAPMLLAAQPGSRDAGDDDADEAGDEAVREASPTGMVVLFTVAPELGWTNLPTQPLMVPVVQEVVRQGLGLIRAEQTIDIGTRPRLTRDRSAVDVVGPDEIEIALDDDGRPQRAIRRAGIYRVVDSGGSTLSRHLVNIEPDSARTTTQSDSAVMSWLSASGPWRYVDDENRLAALRDVGGGFPLAGIALLAVLALIVMETLFGRYFSHAFRAEASGDQTSFGTSGRGHLSMSGGAAR